MLKSKPYGHCADPAEDIASSSRLAELWLWTLRSTVLQHLQVLLRVVEFQARGVIHGCARVSTTACSHAAAVS